jgi:hypothetical protein
VCIGRGGGSRVGILEREIDVVLGVGDGKEKRHGTKRPERIRSSSCLQAHDLMLCPALTYFSFMGSRLQSVCGCLNIPKLAEKVCHSYIDGSCAPVGACMYIERFFDVTRISWAE